MLNNLSVKLREALQIAWMVITKSPRQILEENRKLRRELRQIEREIGLPSISAMPTGDLKELKRGLEGLAERLGEGKSVEPVDDVKKQ